MEIFNLKISELKPYEKNARINDNAVDYVANSIKQFGFNVPILIDKNNIIIAGHTRYKACLKLNKKNIPCILVDDLTDEQIKAYRLIDNKVAEMSSWDYEKLKDEMKILDSLGVDMNKFGFLKDDDIFIDFHTPPVATSEQSKNNEYVCPCCKKTILKEDLKKCEQ